MDVETRWLALIHFKNGMDRYWRKTTKTISIEEQADIRQRILQGLEEPHRQVRHVICFKW